MSSTRWFLLPNAALAIALAATAVHALPADDAPGGPSPEPPTRSALTFAATPIWSLADFCGASEFASNCSSRAFLGADLGARIRLDDAWALAPFLRFGVEAGSRGVGTSTEPLCPAGEICGGSSSSTLYTSQLGAAGVAAHVHPFGGGLWLAPGVGALLLRDLADERIDAGPETRSSLYRWGVELGGAVGHDVHLSETFALTASARVAAGLFPGAEPAPLQGSTASSGPLVALALGGWFALE